MAENLKNPLYLFRAMREKALPHMEAYQSDLDIDFQSICERYYKDGTLCAFAYVIRPCGTHLDFALPLSAMPKAGEQIPYLFGKADARKLAETIGETVDYFHGPESSQVKAILWYDGEGTLTETTLGKARARLFAHRAEILRAIAERS